MKSARAIVLCGTLALVGLAAVLSRSLPAQQATGGDDSTGVIGEQGIDAQQGGVGQAGAGAVGREEQRGRSGAGTEEREEQRGRSGADSGAGRRGGAAGGTYGFNLPLQMRSYPAMQQQGFRGQGQGANTGQFYFYNQLNASDPLQGEDAQLERQSHELAGKYAKAEDDEARQTLRGELADVIAKHFDVRHELRERELREIEARVTRLREALERRQGSRQEIIDRRLEQLLSDAQGVGF